MKRLITLILIIVQCIVLAGCVYESKQLLPEDAFWWTDYKQTHKKCLPLYDLGMFPRPESSPDISDYYFKVDHGIHADSIQLYMQCKYTEECYLSERDRLLNSPFNCCYRTKQGEYDYAFERAKYSTSGFKYPGVIVAIEDECGCEYALLNESELIITYVLLQFVELSEVQFDHSFLPLDENGEPTTLYEFEPVKFL